MFGFCLLCGEWEYLTEHHLLGVRDTHNMNPGLTVDQAKNFEYKLRKQGNHSVKVLACRKCHNILEHSKKAEDEKPRNLNIA